MLQSLLSKAQPKKEEYFVWSVDGKPVSVHLNLDTAAALDSMVRDGLASLPRRGLEIGGLLIGRVRHPNPDQYTVSIEDAVLIESEHLRGPSYILSSTDKEELFNRIRKYSKSKEDLEPVGYFRSHTRPGLYLDQYDFDVLRSYFAHPSCVALLLRPSYDGPTTAGFFIWEEGDIHRASSYREFPLETEFLRQQVPAQSSDASAPVDVPLPEPEIMHTRPIEAEPAIPARAPAARTIAAVPADSDIPEPPAPELPKHVAVEADEIRPRGRSNRRFTLPSLVWVPTVAVLIALAGFLWYQRAKPVSRAHNILMLGAEPTPKGLRLTWDRMSPAFKGGASAKLWITDTHTQKQLTLDPLQLRSGSLIYWPLTDDVNFRMEIGGFTESLRTIAPTAPAQSPAPAVAERQPEIEPVKPAQQAPSQQSRSRQVQPVRRAILPTPKAEPPQMKLTELSPPNVHPAPARLDPPVIHPRAEAKPPRTVANVEPVRESGLKRTVGAIPAILIGRRKDTSQFVPAKATRQVNPSLPGNLKLDTDAEVSVKIALDESGNVKGTDLVTRRADSRLANAAMEAAKKWRFEPARMQNRAVDSSLILHFKFSRDPNSGS